MRRGELRKKVLYALAAASVVTFVQGGGAEAADADHILITNDQMTAELVDLPQGGYIYGIAGGGIYVDDGVRDTVDFISRNVDSVVSLVEEAAPSLAPSIEPIADTIGTINDNVSSKTNGASGDVSIEGDTGLTLEDYDHDWIRYYGAVGGDISVNAGLSGDLNLNLGGSGNPLLSESVDTTITRNGDVTNTITGGSVLIGSGGSAAIAVGNINAVGDYSTNIDIQGIPIPISIDGDVSLDGTTTTVINGNVTTNATEDANLVGWTNGGIAAGIGGTATSAINGDTVLTIDGSDRSDHTGDYEKQENDAIPQVTTVLNVMKGSKVSAIGVAGGGTAATTFGGTATSEVTGTTTVNVNNATVIGVAGGGVAGSIGATGIADKVLHETDPDWSYGNDDETVTITGSQLENMTGTSLPEDLTITINEAIDGGTATSATGDTNINLTGSTTAVGVMGGGVAAAYQDYTWKADGTNDVEDMKAGNVYGSAEATATTGRSTITIDLAGDGDASALSEAIQNIYTGYKENAIQADDLAGLEGQGMAVAVFGGGTAFAYGDATGTLDDTTQGAIATTITEGSDINLNSGYAAGVFGGGAAIAVNTAQAKSVMTDDVNITTASGMETVAIVGGGLAWSGEQAPNTGEDFMSTPSAETTVQTVNITNEGDTDGIFGGGVAMGVSNRTGSQDAVSTVDTSNITINDGTVSTVNMDVLMGALQNTNENTWPQWSFMGFNVSSYMTDIKGILDDAAIVGGGLGLGLTGYAEVGTSNITINGGTVDGDILGGGIAVDNMDNANGGSYVGESTITLNGGTVDGSVYAGGAINKTTSQLVIGTTDEYGNKHGYNTSNTSSTVGMAEVVLNGVTVTGEISGQGFEVETKYSEDGNFNPFYNDNEITYDKTLYESVGESTLILMGENTLTPLDTSDETVSYTSDSKIHDFDYVNVEAGSTTTLDSSIQADSTALINGGLITVDSSAYLDVSNLEATTDASYNIATNYEEGSTFWSDDNLIYDRLDYYATGTDTGGGNGSGSLYSISYEAIDEDNWQEAAESMGNLIDAGPLQPIVDEGFRLGWDTDKGVSEGGREYFDDWSKNPQKNKSFRRGTLIGEDTGVTASTVSVARDIADIVAEHFSFTEDFVRDPGSTLVDGGIWARYINKSYEMDNMDSSFGGVSADTDFDGVIVGADFAKHGKFQGGVAVHYGNGDSTGSFSRNDFDAYGVTLYGSIKDEEARTNLMFDVGYTKTSNDLTGVVNGKDMTADRDLAAWSIGVRGEKEFVSGHNQIVPYVGLRFMRVDASSYTAYYNGKKAFDYDPDDQNIWLLPLGVSFRNESKAGHGWRITPKVDVAYIWAFGDTDNDVNISLAGASAPLHYTVMDDGSWLGAVGLEASHDAWTFGAGYAYQKGDDTKNKTWYINAGFAF